jgi:hypothetical protein
MTVTLEKYRAPRELYLVRINDVAASVIEHCADGKWRGGSEVPGEFDSRDEIVDAVVRAASP